jgi:hypothetical protein
MKLNPLEIELTEKDIQKLISSTFDSVNLINNLNNIPNKTENDVNRIVDNKKHLEIISKKDWFIANLTPTQKSIVESIIYSI